MAYIEIPSADLAVGKPTKKSLMDNINDNLIDHESRITALSAGANKVVMFEMNVDVADLGIGQIMTSDMTLTEFQKINGVEWVLCDGGSAGSSLYNTLTGHANVPDLQDEFLRGASGTRTLGSTQADATAVNGLTNSTDGAHTHTNPSGSFTGGGSQGYYPDITVTGTTNTGSSGSHTHTLSGDSETRPQNYAVNFFIKINYVMVLNLKAREDQTIVNVKGYVIDNSGLPSAGNFEFDILKSSTTRAALTTVFTTKPTLAYSATVDGDVTSSGTFAGGGADVVAGDWLKLEVTSLMTNQSGVYIQVYSEPA